MSRWRRCLCSSESRPRRKPRCLEHQLPFRGEKRDIERERLRSGGTEKKEREQSGGQTSKSYTTPIFHRIEQLQHPKWNSIGLTEQQQPLTEQLQRPNGTAATPQGKSVH